MGKSKAWEVSDAFWEKVSGLIPSFQRDPGRSYRRKPGAGRPPMDPRKVFEAIVYVFNTGVQWKALPKTVYGSPSAIHTYFQKWHREGFFTELWRAGLAEYDELEGIAWKWLSVEGSQGKAPLAQEAVGPNPTDRGKNGNKVSLLVEGRGLPLSLVVCGGNRHDVTQLEGLLDAMVVPDLPPDGVIHLCAGKGYRGAPANGVMCDRGFTPHLPVAVEDRTIVLNGPDHQPRRWIVEVAHSWFKRFRGILVRYEKTEASFTALLHLAAAIICWRRVEIIYG